MYVKRTVWLPALMAAMLAFSACSGGGEPRPAPSAAPKTAGSAEGAVSVDIDFDLNEPLRQLDSAMSGFGLDFYNTDFTSYDFTDPDNFHIIQLARSYIPVDYEEPGVARMDAAELQMFMKEAFGADIPLQSVGMYEYIPEEGVFAFPDSDAGYGMDVFKPTGLSMNPDGGITAQVDHIFIEHILMEPETLEMVSNKPVEEWDDTVLYAKIASPVVTFQPNEDYKYYPMRLIKTETKINDWKQAQGGYEREDGKARLTLDAEILTYGRRVSLRATDESGVTRNMNGIVTANFAYLAGAEYTAAAFMTLNDDGTLSIYDRHELETDLAGKYVKTSDAPVADVFSMEYDTYNVTGNEKPDAPGEPNYIGSYQIPFITGMGDEEFDDYVTKYIRDAVSTPQAEFTEGYNEFLASIVDESDQELKANLWQLAGRYSYVSALSLLSSAEDIQYYAVANAGATYTGGAHGDSFVRMFNINGTEKKLLTLADIFKDGDFKAVLERNLAEKAKTDAYKDLLFPDAQITVSDDSGFYLKKGELIIFYHPYDIGPYSSSYIVFSIPFGEIGDILKDEYLNATYKEETTWDGMFNALSGAM